MVENGQKNKSWAESLNSLVIEFFKKKLPYYVLANQTSHGQYWGVEFNAGDVTIRIGGDIGFSINVIIDGKEYELWQYDRSVNRAMDTTEKNILYQLEVLRRFLDESQN